MFFYEESWMALAVRDSKIQEAQRKARLQVMVRVTSPREKGWLSCQGGRIVSSLGQRLVLVGEALQGSGLAQPSR